MATRYNPITERKKIRKSMDDARRAFNKDMADLIKLACERNQANEDLKTIRSIFATIRAAEPTIIITNAGPYIWKYREQIAKKDANFFLKNNFENDIADFYDDPVPDEQHDFTEDEVGEVLKSIKRTWHLLSAPEKGVIWTTAIGLLRSYAQYVQAERKVKDINKKINNLRK